MYWEKIKSGLEEVEAISRLGRDEVYSFSEKCREKLYDLLDEEGIVLLEQFICCLEFLEHRGCFCDKK